MHRRVARAQGDSRVQRAGDGRRCDPRYRGGRPRRITTEQRQRIVAVAGARPDTQGVAADALVAARLADHLAEAGDAAGLARRISAACWPTAGLSFQRTRTWKASPDPDYEAKAARSSRCAPAAAGRRGRVISFDQMGPVSLRPTAGAGWAPAGRPERQRATYQPPRTAPATCSAPTTSTHDRLRVRLRPRRRGSDNARLHGARSAPRYPARRRIYWIQDNLSANWTPDIRAFAAAHRIELVADPDLRQLPQPGRVPLLRDHRVRRQQRRLPRLGRLRLGARPPRLPPQRPPPRPTHRGRRSPPPDRRLMTLRVQHYLKGH